MDKLACVKNKGVFSTFGAELGFTLVELLVALVIGSILSVAVLSTVMFTAGQDKNQSEAIATNDGARAALTLMTRDLSSAGFLFGSVQAPCSFSLTYNGNNSSSVAYGSLAPIVAASEAAGASLPENINASYPAAGNTNSSYAFQAIYATMAQSGADYTQSTSAPIYVVQFGTTQSANGQGAISSTNLPIATLQLNSTSGLVAGDTALLQVPMNGGNVCFRVPIASIGSNTGQGTTYIKSKPSSYMPSNGYQDFASHIPGSYGTLTNSNLEHARIVNIGSTPGVMQVYAYYITQTNGLPVLMRNVYSALDDQLLSSQAVAPGVVSLQMLFGTVPVNSSPGTAVTWKTWGAVTANDQIMTIDIALVVRTIHDDLTYSAPAVVPVPQPQTGLSAPNMFVNYTPQAAEKHRHFQVYTTQIQMRNLQNESN